MTAFDPEAFTLLEAFEANNDRDWFKQHRADVDQLLRQPMATFLEAVSEELADGAWPMRGSAATMMSQQRDTRYAPVPYHTSIRGLLSSHGGRLARDEGGGHVELDRLGGFIAAGFHQPPATVLAPIRRRMLAEPDRYVAAIGALTDAGLQLAAGQVKTMPRGFSENRDHPIASELRRTTLTVTQPITREQWISGEALPIAIGLLSAAMPLLAFGHAR